MTLYKSCVSRVQPKRMVSERDYFGYGDIRPRGDNVDASRCCHRDVKSKTGKRVELRCGSVESPEGRKGPRKCGWYGDTLERTISGRIMRCPDCLLEGRHTDG